MERWSGKVCVVTGASAGIGADIAKKLVHHGCQVVGLARRVELVEEIAKLLQGEKGKLIAKKCDVADEKEVETCFCWIKTNIGAVHVLVNNAAIIKNETILDGNPQSWKAILNTNVLGLTYCTHLAIKQMREHDIQGHIVNISSIAGHQVIKIEEPTFNMYSSSKFAVTALQQVIALELARLKLKIKITNVSPGLVTDTNIFDAGSYNIPQDVFKSMPHIVPEDVAEAVIYVLGTPPHVQVRDLIIGAVNEVY